MVQIEKDIAAGPQGEDSGDRVKTARAEADAARERAETIQRSRNCEWLRLRWHAVASCALGPPESFSAVEPLHGARRVESTLLAARFWPLWANLGTLQQEVHVCLHARAYRRRSRAGTRLCILTSLPHAVGAKFRMLTIGVRLSYRPKCHHRSIRTDFFEKQKQLTQPPPPSVLAQRAQQQAMLLQKASSSTGGVVLAGSHRPQALPQPSFCFAKCYCTFCIVSHPSVHRASHHTRAERRMTYLQDHQDKILRSHSHHDCFCNHHHVSAR